MKVPVRKGKRYFESAGQEREEMIWNLSNDDVDDEKDLFCCLPTLIWYIFGAILIQLALCFIYEVLGSIYCYIELKSNLEFVRP